MHEYISGQHSVAGVTNPVFDVSLRALAIRLCALRTMRHHGVSVRSAPRLCLPLSPLPAATHEEQRTLGDRTGQSQTKLTMHARPQLAGENQFAQFQYCGFKERRNGYSYHATEILLSGF